MGKGLRRQKAARQQNSLAAKRKRHEDWKASRGIAKPKRSPRHIEVAKRIHSIPDYKSPDKGLPETSNKLGRGGSKPLPDPEMEAAYRETGKRVAPAYNKGPLMYMGEFDDSLTNNGRGK